jgi:hypothetical protein
MPLHKLVPIQQAQLTIGETETSRRAAKLNVNEAPLLNVPGIGPSGAPVFSKRQCADRHKGEVRAPAFYAQNP